MMKLKTITRDEWTGIKEKLYSEQKRIYREYRFTAGLIQMIRAEDFYVNRHGLPFRITASGYSWLCLAPENRNWWATCMFDQTGNLTQIYFDITSGNIIEPDGKSRFYDMYLDVLYNPQTGETELLDEDELKKAFQSGEITGAMYESAYAAADNVLQILRDNEAFIRFVTETRAMLL